MDTVWPLLVDLAHDTLTYGMGVVTGMCLYYVYMEKKS